MPLGLLNRRSPAVHGPVQSSPGPSWRGGTALARDKGTPGYVVLGRTRPPQLHERSHPLL